jgi:hypothetical protein
MMDAADPPKEFPRDGSGTENSKNSKGYGPNQTTKININLKR